MLLAVKSGNYLRLQLAVTSGIIKVVEEWGCIPEIKPVTKEEEEGLKIRVT